jgi:hypothetical protein
MVIPSIMGLELLASEHLNGALVGGREALPLADDLAHLVHGVRLQAGRDEREDQHAGVARVPHVAGGAVGIQQDSSSLVK